MPLGLVANWSPDSPKEMGWHPFFVAMDVRALIILMNPVAWSAFLFWDVKPELKFSLEGFDTPVVASLKIRVAISLEQ